MNKKQVILTGRLAAPLCEGSRAWIRHHSGLVCTSRVVRMSPNGSSRSMSRYTIW